MKPKVQLTNASKPPSYIKERSLSAIEVNFKQLFLIRASSWDQPRRYLPSERLRFYKQPILCFLSECIEPWTIIRRSLWAWPRSRIKPVSWTSSKPWTNALPVTRTRTKQKTTELGQSQTQEATFNQDQDKDPELGPESTLRPGRLIRTREGILFSQDVYTTPLESQLIIIVFLIFTEVTEKESLKLTVSARADLNTMCHDWSPKTESQGHAIRLTSLHRNAQVLPCRYLVNMPHCLYLSLCLPVLARLSVSPSFSLFLSLLFAHTLTLGPSFFGLLLRFSPLLPLTSKHSKLTVLAGFTDGSSKLLSPNSVSLNSRAISVSLLQSKEKTSSPFLYHSSVCQGYYRLLGLPIQNLQLWILILCSFETRITVYTPVKYLHFLLLHFDHKVEVKNYKVTSAWHWTSRAGAKQGLQPLMNDTHYYFRVIYAVRSIIWNRFIPCNHWSLKESPRLW